MGWTEDRVAILTKLWMQGLSAAQIAVELGGGVTRNAVIGKVHRLKLSGRVKPATSSARARTRTANKTPRRASTSTGSTSATMRKRSISSAPTLGATALKPQDEHENELHVAKEQMHELFIPEGERLSLLDLNEDVCKWPIGDPINPDFYFCGKHSLDGKPYCEFHSARAYHKNDRRKR